MSDYDIQDDVGNVSHTVRPGVRGFTSTFSPTIHIPARRDDDELLTQLLRPDIHMSSSSSSSRPDIHMSSASASTKRKPIMFNIADDMDEEIDKQHQEKIDEIEMQEMHDDSKLHSLLARTRSLLHEVQNTSIGDMLMAGPENPQRSTSGSKREKSPSPEETKPKSKAKYTPKKFTRPNPEADNEPERTAKKQKKPKSEEDPQRLTRTIKADNKATKQKPKHDTDKVVYESFNEWSGAGKAFLVDQIYKRQRENPKIKFSKTDARNLKKPEMIKLLLEADGKYK